MCDFVSADVLSMYIIYIYIYYLTGAAFKHTNAADRPVAK